MFTTPTAAQTVIVADGSTATIVTSGGATTTIDGGTLAGTNLFHSFAQFDLSQADIAQWVRGSPDAASITNVINRVTGGSRSTIDGKLSISDMPGADFWFVNPAGFVFGPASSIDVPGAAFLSTSQELRFADGTAFRTVTPEGSTFSSAPPEAFGFLEGQADIMAFDVFWTVGDLTMTAANVEFSGFLESDALSLVAFGSRQPPLADPSPGEIYLNFGEIYASSISLRADALALEFFTLSSGFDAASGNSIRADRFTLFESGIGFSDTRTSGGTIGATPIKIEGQFLSLENSSIEALAEGTAQAPVLQLTFDEIELNASFIGSLTVGLDRVASDGTVTPAADSGRFEINTQLLHLFNTSEISTDTFGDGNAGAITLNAASLLMEDGSVISANTHSAGDGGLVAVTIGSGSLYDASQISSDADFGSTGNAGNIEIDAGSNLELFGQSFITSSAGLGSLGNGGSIRVGARSISLDAGSEIQSNTFDAGNAGNVTVTADELYVFGGAFIASQASPESTGDGGNLNVSGGQLVMGGGAINTTTFGLGDAGSILLDFDRIDLGELSVVTSSALSISSAPARAGSVALHFDRLEMDNAVIASSTNTAGEGGTITLHGGAAVLSNLATISVGTLTGSSGMAGSIRFDVDTLALTGGSVVGSQTLAAGNAGSISITASAVELIEGAQLTSSSLGDGDGGNVSISAGMLNIDNAAVSAVTGASGQGGFIEISAAGIDAANSSAITVTTEGTGKAGSISLTGGSIGLDNSVVSSVSVAGGDAGEIGLFTTRLNLFNGARITTDSAFGPAGDITMLFPDDGQLVIRGEMPGTITTTSGANSGGRIVIANPYLILSDGGSILALGEVSNANVRIASEYFIRSFDAVNRLAVDGNLILDSQFSDLSAGTEAPDIAFLDASSVLASRCAATRSSGRTSSFASRIIGPHVTSDAGIHVSNGSRMTPKCTP